MHRRAALVAGLTALAITHADTALAAQSIPTAKPLAGAHAPVSSCGDLSAIGITWTVTAGAVTSINLAAIPSTCVGATLSVTLVDTAKASLATAGPVLVSDTTNPTTVAPVGSADATAVSGAYVSAVGP